MLSSIQTGGLEHSHLEHPVQRRHTTITTTESAIANRLRQIRDRSHPANRARSARRVASRIYTTATVVYLSTHRFTATFPDQRRASEPRKGPEPARTVFSLMPLRPETATGATTAIP